MTGWRPLWKDSRTARKKAKARARTKLAGLERDAKNAVRRRDQHRCRFPLCGCRKLGLALKARGEVSHERHKGMGGNPAGDRSTRAGMVLLCGHRHQDGRISRHKGTLRARFLTRDGYDGPVAWEIDARSIDALGRRGLRGINTGDPQWREVARELRPQVLEVLTDWQRETLDELAKMEL